MTAGQISQRVLEKAGEIVQSGDVRAFHTDAQALAAVNQAQRLFCFLTLCVEATGTLTVSSGVNWQYAMTTLPNWIVPLKLRRASDGVALRPVRVQDLDGLDASWQAVTGAIERYACLGFDLVGFYRTPAAGTENVDATYAKSPAVMTSGSTPEIPEEYHASLVDGAVPLLRLKEGADELAKAFPYFDRFLAAAQKMAAYVRQRNLAQRYDRVPFELERFDRSKLLRLAIPKVKPPLLADPAMAGKG